MSQRLKPEIIPGSRAADWRPSANELLQNTHIPVLRRDVQRSIASLLGFLLAWRRAGRQQQAHHVLVLLDHCSNQWRCTRAVPGIDVCTVLQQQLRHLAVPLHGGKVQASAADMVSGIDILPLR